MRIDRPYKLAASGGGFPAQPPLDMAAAYTKDKSSHQISNFVFESSLRKEYRYSIGVYETKDVQEFSCCL